MCQIVQQMHSDKCCKSGDRPAFDKKKRMKEKAKKKIFKKRLAKGMDLENKGEMEVSKQHLDMKMKFMMEQRRKNGMRGKGMGMKGKDMDKEGKDMDKEGKD